MKEDNIWYFIISEISIAMCLVSMIIMYKISIGTVDLRAMPVCILIFALFLFSLVFAITNLAKNGLIHTIKSIFKE